MENELLTVAEIAAKYEVSGTAVRKWLANGLPRSMRREVGRKEYSVIDPDDVDEYLKVGTYKAAEKMNTAEQ